VQADAANGIGFFYGRHYIDDGSSETFTAFLDYWNSKPVLDTFSEVSGEKIICASA